VSLSFFSQEQKNREIIMSLSGHSHSFDTGIAKHLGLHCAVIYNHIIYWLRINAAKGQGIVEGKVWMYESQQQIADFLEYISLDEIKKAIPKLIEAGYLVKGNHNKNPFNKTAWYTIENQDLIQKNITKVPIRTLDSANSHLPKCQSAPCIYDKEDKEIRTNDDDDRVHARDEVLRTFDTKGNPVSSDVKALIDQMRMKRFSDATIKEALKRTESSSDPISNVLKYVQMTCKQIDAQNAKELVHNPKHKEKTWNQKKNQKSPKYQQKEYSNQEDISISKTQSMDSKDNITAQDMSVHPFQIWPSRLKSNKSQ
jgi:hypothetical protein